ncbi:hypothetical protein A3D88_00535 [Candidatus Peribacteria bacterium RIFCSPHIGHO2_02_FULL_52_16]|nr:MAG: hypothetical protein A2706_01390 [Candidatus Peribacteria bacterium RIFCSPHIGHO2_01_FULL_51_35]OGJ61960.1 MAG: hypothetical protein A3D88_00535 [Candidatus Peribacteria bacterium RIFCSPHIGHO2_02_FULL_52_16]
MGSEIKDYSTSPDTAWMKEVFPGQFYGLYRSYYGEAHRSILRLLPPSLKKSWEKDPDCMEEMIFYRKLDAMKDETRREMLRNFMMGHATAIKESEARINQFVDEHPITNVRTEQQGGYVVQAFAAGQSRRGSA